MLQLNSPTEINKYLILPSVPTPNGSLHLGHIGGPFLSADVFARHVQLLGHKADIIVGTDSYESFVLARAKKESKSAEDTCHYFHNLITKDLALFNVKTTEIVNPLDQQWQEKYQYWHYYILDNLQKNNAITAITEQVVFNQAQKNYLTGCWLKGACPHCAAESVGYFCESCGAHFRPEEMVLPPNNDVSSDCSIDNLHNLFMQLPQYFDLVEKGISEAIVKAYQQFLMKQNYLFRLTANSQWGLAIPEIYNLSESTLFNYGLMFAYFLMMGEIAGKMHDDKNVFAADSDVITICSFGLDNAVPFLASILGITEHCANFKPFDYYFVNHFYHLDGSKFSTSRNHAIWATDLIENKGAQSDIVRFFLALIDVRSHIGDFNTSQFIVFYNNWVHWLQSYIVQPITILKKPAHECRDGQLIQKLNHLLQLQHQDLQADHFMPHLAAEKIIEWQNYMSAFHPTHQNYYWLLKGFVILAYPFMPEISELIWLSLGYQGKPTVFNFTQLSTQPLKNLLPIKMKPMAINELNHFDVSPMRGVIV